MEEISLAIAAAHMTFLHASRLQSLQYAAMGLLRQMNYAKEMRQNHAMNSLVMKEGLRDAYHQAASLISLHASLFQNAATAILKAQSNATGQN